MDARPARPAVRRGGDTVSVTIFRRVASDEEGSMIALFAVAAFALLLVAAFVIDVGNWQEHRRHVQVQVDNGAKASGIYFTGCFLDPAGSNASIRREARKYAGDPQFETTFPSNGVPYNLQVDDPDRVVLNLNRSDWPQMATPGVFGDDFEDRLRPRPDGSWSSERSVHLEDAARPCQGPSDPHLLRRGRARTRPTRRRPREGARGDRQGDRHEGLPALGGA